MLREPRVQQRFEVAKILHPLGQRVADDHDLIVRLQLELGFRRRRMTDEEC